MIGLSTPLHLLCQRVFPAIFYDSIDKSRFRPGNPAFFVSNTELHSILPRAREWTLCKKKNPVAGVLRVGYFILFRRDSPADRFAEAATAVVVVAAAVPGLPWLHRRVSTSAYFPSRLAWKGSW